MLDFIGNVIVIVTGIVTVASLIAAATDTPKDDELIGKLYKLVDILALNIGKAKDCWTLDLSEEYLRLAGSRLLSRSRRSCEPAVTAS